MQKIPTLFKRDPENMRRVLVGQVTPGCEWVIAGEGKATRKYDGTCCYFDASGAWWARREVKKGQAVPANFVPVASDEITGKLVGWEPIEQSGFARIHKQADFEEDRPVGTYELVGPRINGNPDQFPHHELIQHGVDILPKLPPLALIDLCRINKWEGVVWHHRDGRMCKLKVRDVAP